MQDPDVDFGQEDFQVSLEHDISDINITALRNKGLTRIDIVLKSDSGQSIDIMRWYLSLKAYVFKIEQELGVMEEPPEMM